MGDKHVYMIICGAGYHSMAKGIGVLKWAMLNYLLEKGFEIAADFDNSNISVILYKRCSMEEVEKIKNINCLSAATKKQIEAAEV